MRNMCYHRQLLITINLSTTNTLTEGNISECSRVFLNFGENNGITVSLLLHLFQYIFVIKVNNITILLPTILPK